MRFSSLIWKNLFRRPLRSGLTLTALATAIAAVVGLTGISRGFTRSFGEIYTAHAVDIVVSRQGSTDRFSSSVNADFADTIGQLPEIDRAAGVLLDTLSLEELGVYGVPTMGIDTTSWLMKDYEITSQSDITAPQNDGNSGSDGEAAGDEGPGRVAYLGIHLADRLELAAGETFQLFDETYTIAGLFRSPSTWENGALLIPLETLQEITDRIGQVTYINVVLKKSLAEDPAEAAIKSIEALDARLMALATSEFVETDMRMRVAGAMAWMTSAIALILGTIGTLNTMLMSVLERTREIGILRAIGWPRRRIIGMILCESCGLALAASILGCILASLLVWALSQAPPVKGLLSPFVSVDVMAQGVCIGMLIGIIGALLPALRAARMMPTDAFGKQE